MRFRWRWPQPPETRWPRVRHRGGRHLDAPREAVHGRPKKRRHAKRSLVELRGSAQRRRRKPRRASPVRRNGPASIDSGDWIILPMPLPVTDTRPFFRPLAAEIVSLLRSLAADDWLRPTVAGSWRVREVVAHLADTAMRRVSLHRDGWQMPGAGEAIAAHGLVPFINDLNARWITA